MLSWFLVSFLLEIAACHKQKQLWEQREGTRTIHFCKCLKQLRRDNSQWVCHIKQLLSHTSNIDYWCFNVFWYRSSVALACYEKANMACQSSVLQCWVVLEADLRVAADPCTLLDDDPVKHTGVQTESQWQNDTKFTTSKLTQLSPLVTGQHGSGRRGWGRWEGLYLWCVFVLFFSSLLTEYQCFYMLMNRKEVSLHVDKDDLRFLLLSSLFSTKSSNAFWFLPTTTCIFL